MQITMEDKMSSIKVEIEKVQNGYILTRDYYALYETTVYRDFLEVIMRLAFIFDERISEEEAV